MARTILKIEGMTCAGCAATIENALRKVPGVTAAQVNFATETATVEGDAPPEALEAAVADAGYRARTIRREDGAGQVVLAISGMTCAGCARTIENALRKVPGVTAAEVNVATEQATVTGRDLDPARLIAAVERAGYGARLVSRSAGALAGAGSTGTGDDSADSSGELRERLILAGAGLLTLPLVAQMVAGWLDIPFHLTAGTQLALALPVQLIAGARFYTGAYKALRHGGANMDVLVALGTTAAFAYSLAITWQLGLDAHDHLYYEAAAVIVTLVRLGKYLEARAKRSTTAAIRALMNLQPEIAHVVTGDTVRDVPAASVAVGTRILVRPGERVPVDGVILEGESELDESMITGESRPVHKGPGDMVTGGTLNGSGLLTIEARAVGADAVVARMAALVAAAQSAKPPMQQLADRVAAVFVPVVLIIAALTFAGWLLAGGPLDAGVGAAVAVMVVACPCALGLATPAAIAAGTGAAARAGILIRDPEALERAQGLRQMFFDKTGTLTYGKPAVTDFITVPDADPAEVLLIAASAQTGSEHPLAHAVLAHAAEKGLTPGRPESFRQIPGRGLEARVRGHDVLIGSAALLSERGIDPGPLAGEGARLAAALKTVAFVVIDGRVVACIAMADRIREGAREAIAALAARGIEAVLLTGDARPIAEAVARTLGITRVCAEVRPEHKADVVAQARAHGPVGMVGDGVNDAPALAVADLSMAMGGGSAAALETASITLMRPEPRLVPAALDVAGATRRKVRQNLFWAFAYNVALIPVAAAGLLNPALAGGAMAASSLCVLANALLLARWQPAIPAGQASMPSHEEPSLAETPQAEVQVP